MKHLCGRFSRERDIDVVSPHELYRAMGDAGWLSLAILEAYGGARLGVQEAALTMQTVAEWGARLSGCSAIRIHINININIFNQLREQ